MEDTDRKVGMKLSEKVMQLLENARQKVVLPIAHREMLRVRRELIKELKSVRDYYPKDCRKPASLALKAVESSGCKTDTDFIYGISVAKKEVGLWQIA